MHSFILMVAGGLCITTGLLLGLTLDQENVLYPNQPVHRTSASPAQVNALIDATFSSLKKDDSSALEFAIPSKHTVPDADSGTLRWLGYPVAIG